MEKIGPKYKICRRLGSDVFEKCQTQKYMFSESRKSKNLKRKKRPKILTDYGRQLLEKQKVRFTYGLSEKQFKNLVNKAILKKDKESVSTLFESLEKRLDNVVYRIGLAKTRRMARQMVSHGHVKVNGKKVTVPSFQVSQGDTVEVRESSRDSVLFSQEGETSDVSIPNWLKFDLKKLQGSVIGNPMLDVKEGNLDLNTVIEFYSK